MKTYYYLSKDNTPLGPISAAMLHDRLKHKTITQDTLVCAAGEQEWHQLSEILKTEEPEKAIAETMSSWYIYKQGGAEIGPVSKEELQELFRAGNITRKTPVRISGTKDWMDYNDLTLWRNKEELNPTMEREYCGAEEEKERKLKWNWDEPKRWNNPKPSTQIPRPKFKAPKNNTHTRAEGLELAILWRGLGYISFLAWLIIAIVRNDEMPGYVIVCTILGSIVGTMLCLTLATIVQACAIYIAKRQQPLP